MGEIVEKILKVVNDRWDKYLEEVRNFLRIPSISGTGEGIEETASFLRDWLKERLGIEATLLRYGGHPIVYGRVKGKGSRTLILYNMYDVQPVEPLDKWITPPFEARIVEGKIIARGAINTKAPLMALLLGLEVLKDVFGGEYPLNLILAFEGEEELGSPSMPKFIEDKKGELKEATAAYFQFPTESKRGVPKVILGNKGIVFLELKVKTSKYDVHSSLSQGFDNPAIRLANAI